MHRHALADSFQRLRVIGCARSSGSGACDQNYSIAHLPYLHLHRFSETLNGCIKIALACKLFTASLLTHAKNKRAKRARSMRGWGVGVGLASAVSKKKPGPHLLSSLLFCTGVQFSRDSIPARVKIRENRA